METITQTTREKLVGNILFYAQDELESKEDLTQIAMESEEQLLDRLISILDYYYSEYDENENK